MEHNAEYSVGPISTVEFYLKAYLEPHNINKVYRNMPRGNKGEKGKGSGIKCVAANCGNTNADGVSLHTFPKDPFEYSSKRKATRFEMDGA
jgi:hypothetical protein